MFSQVSACPRGGGVCPIACWDTLPGQTPPWVDPLWADTPPGRHPPPWADTPGQTPHWADTPPGQTHPCAVHAGMHSRSGRYASHWNAFLLEAIFPFVQRLSKSIQNLDEMKQ